jgi:hypothetical protein
MTPPVADLIRGALLRQPDPPRELRFLETLRAVLKVKTMRVILAVTLGLAFALCGFGILGVSTDRTTTMVLGLLSLLLSMAPLFYAYRLTKALRHGRIDLAVVESVEYSGPGARDTLDAIENGIARGKWRIAEGTLLDFEVDEPWANELRLGTRVEVLVAGRTAAAVFPLGPRQ